MLFKITWMMVRKFFNSGLELSAIITKQNIELVGLLNEIAFQRHPN